MGDVGGSGRPGRGESPGGAGNRPAGPRPPKPVKRGQFDRIVRDMFHDADADRDGIVTIPELHGVLQARRDRAIRGRFAAIDADHNGSISEAEFIGWQNSMGSAASGEATARGEREGPVVEAIMPDVEAGARGLAALVEPLSGTTIAAANTNYDAGVSLEELLAYQGRRFDAADVDHDGELSMQELRPAGPDGRGRAGRVGPGGPPR